MYCDAKEIQDQPKGYFDEEDWNRVADLRYEPYAYSKTVAEKKAWAMMHAQKQWDLVTINPTFIFGPPLGQRIDGASMSTMQQLLSGQLRYGAPDLRFGVVDVRDVAQAHVLAAIKPEAEGRYLLASQSSGILEMAKMIEKQYPVRYKLPKGALPKWLLYLVGPTQGLSKRYLKNNLGFEPRFNTRRSVEDLGLSYRGFEETLRDTIDALG
jgi:nucleoside-diphosphate-sugar epimerase